MKQIAKQSSKRKVPQKRPPVSFLRKKTDLDYLGVACGSITILALSFFNLALLSAKSTDQVLGLKTEANVRRALLQDKTFWEKFLEENPTYIDGWLELVKVAYRLEDYDYAEGALNSARSIDPNSEKIEGLAKELDLRDSSREFH